nr:1221_t:CDS:10 [Entrophospora candida]
MDSRTIGLGALSVFSDNLISESILSKLPAEDLGRSARVSRFFYVFSRDDQLWKKHCLDKWGDNKEVMRNFVFRGNWLLTYLFPNLLSENEEKEKVWSHPICKPLRFTGDFLPNYSCVPPELKFPIEDGKLLTKEKFESLYDSQSIPVLIKNCDVEEWKAWKNWRFDEFTKKYAKSKFRIANEGGGKYRYLSMTLKSYYDYINNQHDEAPLYIFDPRFGEEYPQLVEEYKIPKYFDQDFFSVLGDKRPPYRWIIIGPARSAWNTVIEGRKRWALYPPDMFPPGLSISSTIINGHQSIYHSSVIDDSRDTTTSLFWYLEVYPQLPPELKPIEIIQEPGQTIFVLNLDNSIAVTQNFVNLHNLENVCESLITEEKGKKDYPYFEKFLSRKLLMLDDNTDDLIIVQEGFSSKAEFIEGFKNLDIWNDRIIKVLSKHNLNDNERIKVVSSGQNPVFRTSKLIIKFYSHLFNGLKNFDSETNSYFLINNYLPSKYKNYFSKILGSGYLYDVDDNVEGDEKKNNNNKYQWPYIIIDDVSKSSDFHDYISNQISKALNNHLSWLIFPIHLILQISDYLPKSPLELYDPNLDGENFAGLLHGDLNSENVLGMISETNDDDDIDGSLNKQQQWKPNRIIDLGDSLLFGGDPLFDLIPIYISIFNSMWYTLLWSYEGAAKYTLKHFPDIRECKNWEEVEDLVWDIEI